jgi:LuxR family maltose regulon positive regulatory protein
MQARYALLLYEWNRLADAEKAVRQSMEIAGHLDTAMPLAFLVLLLNLSTQARLALAQGDRALAGHVLEDIESNVTAFQMDRQQVAELGQRLPGVILARLALACGQLELAVRWGETCGLRFDSSPTFQSMASGYLDALTLARILFVRGRGQGNASSLSQAASLLKRLRDLALEKNWRGRLIEIEMLLALTLQAQGKTRRALTTLGSVLTQAEPEGYLRLFVDEGAPMAHLLAQIAAYTTASAGYIQLLQTALAPRQHLPADPAHTVSHQPLPNPLSPREQEVLQLVARGFSNQQIADHLIISLNTAKRHVKHLLAKLVVTNRTQALARARELHLL